MLIAVITIFFFFLYAVLILYFNIQWRRIKIQSDDTSNGSIKFSILIPARNEEKNIGLLLDSLLSQTYPRENFEIIVIDDDSEDHTVSVVNKYKEIKLIRLEKAIRNSYKKKAIETGVAAATGDYIVTTDADCTTGPKWLAQIAGKIEETNAVFVAAPVLINANGSAVQVFQAMDFMVLQGITAVGISKGSLSMCNGANMCYSKDAFMEVNGFEGIDQVASGDDMLLLHKIKRKYPDGVQYVKSENAIVKTAPVESWKSFFNQRIRWASKATYYDDKKIFFVLLIVYLFNLMFPLLIVAGVLNNFYWWLFGILLVAKTLVELPFFISLCKFFETNHFVRYFILFQPLHIGYTLVAGLLGQFGKYEWKGRMVK